MAGQRREFPAESQSKLFDKLQQTPHTTKLTKYYQQNMGKLEKFVHSSGYTNTGFGFALVYRLTVVNRVKNINFYVWQSSQFCNLGT